MQGLPDLPFANLLANCIPEHEYNNAPQEIRRVWAYIFDKDAAPEEVRACKIQIPEPISQ